VQPQRDGPAEEGNALGAPRRLNKDVWVGPTPTADLIAQLASWGVKSVINNQRDDEEIRVLTSDECEATAHRFGMGYAHSIVADRFKVTEAEIDEFIRHFDELPKPVFIYCRAGFRAALIWALAQVGKMDMDDIIEEVFAVGYDLMRVGRPQMLERLKKIEAKKE